MPSRPLVSFFGVGSFEGSPAIESSATDVPADLPHPLEPDGDVRRHVGVVQQGTDDVLGADSELCHQDYLHDAELKGLVTGPAG